MMHKPSTLASWLLRTFGCDSDSEAILGDLHERYQTCQSSSWYWREVLLAIKETLFNVQTAFAIATGWVALLCGWRLLEMLSGQPFDWYRHACTFFWFIAGIGSGFTVGLVAQKRRRPAILLHAVSVAVFLVGIHRKPQSPFVFWMDFLVLMFAIVVAALPSPSLERAPILTLKEKS